MAKNKQKLTGKTEWQTPDYLIDLARTIMGRIDLDPATTAVVNERIKANNFFTQEDDALTKEWFGNAWLNPPYARGTINKFVNKVAEEISLGNLKRILVLTNNDTDTQWAKKLFRTMDAVCFLEGRVAYLDENGKPVNNNMQGQALWYKGDKINTFKMTMMPYGQVLIIDSNIG